MNDQYGIEKFLHDLVALGHICEQAVGSNKLNYAVIKNYEVPIGRFQGRVIDLGIPIPDEYPRLIGPSIHIKASPQLLDYSDTVPAVRNIIESPLGQDWRYWSFRLEPTSEDTTKNILLQIHGIFQRI